MVLIQAKLHKTKRALEMVTLWDLQMDKIRVVWGWVYVMFEKTFLRREKLFCSRGIEWPPCEYCQW